MKEPELLIFHDIGFGVNRLLSAPRDLPGTVFWQDPGPLMSEADPEYRTLFERYLDAVQWAVGIAVPWWNSLVRRRMAQGETLSDAMWANYKLRPAGPASRPEVVWAVRSYWLLCDQLNTEMSVNRRIPPEVLLLKWLQSRALSVPIAVLSGMPYWPIGFDNDGRFV